MLPVKHKDRKLRHQNLQYGLIYKYMYKVLYQCGPNYQLTFERNSLFSIGLCVEHSLNEQITVPDSL